MSTFENLASSFLQNPRSEAPCFSSFGRPLRWVVRDDQHVQHLPLCGATLPARSETIAPSHGGSSHFSCITCFSGIARMSLLPLHFPYTHHILLTYPSCTGLLPLPTRLASTSVLSPFSTSRCQGHFGCPLISSS